MGSRGDRMFKKIVSLIIVQVFLITSAVYPQPSSRSIFKDKRVDYKKIQEQREKDLEEKKDALSKRKRSESPIYRKTPVYSVNLYSLKDVSSIYIPEGLGKVVEVHESSSSESRLIVHIQDLHANPEAQLNSASILGIFIKDYGLSLVCSEGAEGEVDTSSVSNFPDPEVREKTARLFVNSGELTGEEYLSITKYPDLPIWGIEDKELYFQNILEFNKIMRFLERVQGFISQVEDVSEGLKPRIYSNELLGLDRKEKEYEGGNLDTKDYVNYLLDSARVLGRDVRSKYKNITLFRESLEFERKIDQERIKNQSQELLTALQKILSEKEYKTEADSLLAKVALFKDQKISPFSFYSYLDELARRHLRDEIVKYPALFNFVEYLEKVNSLDSVRLFQEIEDLTYELKDSLSTNENQRLLTKVIRHIKLLSEFFNLKLSNEELEYYYANKDAFKVSWFKFVITGLTDKTGSTGQTNYIDYNPDLIDYYLPELEHFYQIAFERDIAMVDNAIAEIERRDAKVAAFISGGFHTTGITQRFKEKDYSYVVIAPYSSTGIDEENYRFLLSGKRKPISELIDEMNGILRSPLQFR